MTEARIAELEAEVAELRTWKEHILSHEDRKKRPFSDALAQGVIADQVKEIDRLHSLVAAERRRAEAAEARVKELEAVRRACADALTVADRLIERGYGTDTPNEWHRVMRQVQKAVALISPKDKSNG